MQDSVKTQHILPFFLNFASIARRLEELLTGTEGDSSGALHTWTSLSTGEAGLTWGERDTNWIAELQITVDMALLPTNQSLQNAWLPLRILAAGDCVGAVGPGDASQAGRSEAGRHPMSGSASTESMRRLDNLRYDSDTGRPGWDPGQHGLDDHQHSQLDDIDYMSEEMEDDDLSDAELSVMSDGLRGSPHDGRCDALKALHHACLALLPRTCFSVCCILSRRWLEAFIVTMCRDHTFAVLQTCCNLTFWDLLAAC